MIPTIETWETSIPLTLKTLSTTVAMSSWFKEKGIMSWIQDVDLGVLRAEAAPPGEGWSLLPLSPLVAEVLPWLSNPFLLILTSVHVDEAVGFGASQ